MCVWPPQRLLGGVPFSYLLLSSRFSDRPALGCFDVAGGWWGCLFRLKVFPQCVVIAVCPGCRGSTKCRGQGLGRGTCTQPVTCVCLGATAWRRCSVPFAEPRRLLPVRGLPPPVCSHRCCHVTFRPEDLPGLPGHSRGWEQQPVPSGSLLCWLWSPLRPLHCAGGFSCPHVCASRPSPPCRRLQSPYFGHSCLNSTQWGFQNASLAVLVF